MPYIIDGHNLIAALPGIDLHDPEDERALVDQLQPLATREARKIYVYFDQGQSGSPNDFNVGRVHVRFIVPPRSADDAIQAHLQSIGMEGPNWLVVSSDREVQRQAERLGARTISSSAFIDQKLKPVDNTSYDTKPHPPLTADEIDAWEAFFHRGEDKI